MATATHADDSMDDILGDFDSLDSFDNIEVNDDTPAADPLAWQPSGSLGIATSYNIRDHQSSTGTDYSGLSKLRLRANLGADKKLNDNWRVSLNASGWHDLAYELNDEAYSKEVIAEYETDFQIQEAYVQGKLSDNWDMKLGRQVAVWGFADNLRVLDILNPLDNLEPGLADIEDLRRPVGMIRVTHFRNDWQFGLYVIPEQRLSRNPPFGSDFYTVTDTNGNAIKFREEKPEDFSDINYAASITGPFKGWDISLNVARLWQDEAYLDPSAFNINNPANTPNSFNQQAVLKHSRINMIGHGVQTTWGSWLFKQEGALLNNVSLTETGTVSNPFITVVIPNKVSQHNQASLLLGVEYFGLANTNIGVEVATRYIDNFNAGLKASGYLEKRSESSIRISRDYLNERLKSNFIAVFYNEGSSFLGKDGGAIYRLNADYELQDSLILTGGTVFYVRGKQQPFNAIFKNDRVFAELKWSF